MATLRCFYCKGLFDSSQITKDHVIPRWVLRYFSEFREDHRAILNEHGYSSRNHKPSCHPCNAKKGPIPPAEFMRVRNDFALLRMSKARWGYIAQGFAMSEGQYGDPNHRAMVVAAFSETPSASETSVPQIVIPQAYMTPEERRRAYWKRKVGHLIPLHLQDHRPLIEGKEKPEG